MELIGIIVPQHYYDEGRVIDRPLDPKENTLHIKAGDIYGFLDGVDTDYFLIAE
jgi:hypothetical protein